VRKRRNLTDYAEVAEPIGFLAIIIYYDFLNWSLNVFKHVRERSTSRTLDNDHTTPEKFENAALFLRLGLPSTKIKIVGDHRTCFRDKER